MSVIEPLAERLRMVGLGDFDALPAGFGERLAQQVDALHNDDVPYLGIYRLGWDDAIDSAAALVRREFTQPVSPETNGEG